MDYLKLTELYQKLEKTTKRLEKTYILSGFIKKIKHSDVNHLINLVRGSVYPPWEQKNIGVSARIIIKALATSSGKSAEEIEKMWARIGDLGNVAENLVNKKEQTTLGSVSLTTKKVYDNLRELAELEGEGTVNRKIGLIAELLTSARGIEAKYIVRTILEELRVGVSDGTLRDAIVWVFFGDKLKIKYDEKVHDFDVPDRDEYNKYCEKVQHAYDMTNDFSIVIERIMEKDSKGLDDIKLVIGRPINVMLYQKVKDIAEGFESVGKPCVLEFKYDGFRVIASKKGKDVTLFTRRLENVTRQFPELVALIKTNIKGDNLIVDGEVIGIDPKTKKWLPFQAISQRIKRKYDIEEIAKKIPVALHIFDIIAYENESLLDKPFKKRREIIERIIKPVRDKLEIAKQIVTSDLKKAEAFYKESLSRGNEGIMMKNLEGVYKPGSRVGYGVKVKPILETLDLVVTGAEWGEGKRANWLSSFTLACLSDDGKKFLEIGKVGTGIKEKEEFGVSFEELTKLLKPLIEETKGRSVVIKPRVVVEVAYEEIQKSPTYSSGYALRFPRVINIRDDLGTKDIKNLEEIERIYNLQRGRSE